MYRYFRRFRESRERAKEEDFPFVDVDEATSTVRKLLGSFLSFRFWGLSHLDNSVDQGSQRTGPSGQRTSLGTAKKTYLSVTVDSQNPGLSLEASPAYFITWSYFGAPTSPVTGHLIPGRYIFRGSGTLVPMPTEEPRSFNIPPHLNPVLVYL